MRGVRALVIVLVVCPAVLLGQTTRTAAPSSATPGFRVCSDPNNMPFSNDRGEGFENRIAALLARELGVATPSYIFWGQRQGFIRNTMNATLKEGRCDIVMGVPETYDLVSPTAPYYRSSYVFVYPKGTLPGLRSLDDPRLKTLKIGVHLLGDDYTNPPPVHELGKRHIVDNVVGFSTFYSAQNPPSALVDAVAAKRVDVAIAWGPAAGYFARRQRVPLDVVPIPSAPGDLPFAFNISMGVRRGDSAAKARLERAVARRRADILRILEDFAVPLLPSVPASRKAGSSR